MRIREGDVSLEFLNSMSLFRFRWIHRLIRRKTKPIPEQSAHKWKQRLSFIYMISAWNALGILLYMKFSKKNDWGDFFGIKSEEELTQRPGVYYAELLGLKKVQIVDFKGFKKIGEYEYIQKEENNDEVVNETTEKM